MPWRSPRSLVRFVDRWKRRLRRPPVHGQRPTRRPVHRFADPLIALGHDRKESQAEIRFDSRELKVVGRHPECGQRRVEITAPALILKHRRAHAKSESGAPVSWTNANIVELPPGRIDFIPPRGEAQRRQLAIGLDHARPDPPVRRFQVFRHPRSRQKGSTPRRRIPSVRADEPRRPVSASANGNREGTIGRAICRLPRRRYSCGFEGTISLHSTHPERPQP